MLCQRRADGFPSPADILIGEGQPVVDQELRAHLRPAEDAFSHVRRYILRRRRRFARRWLGAGFLVGQLLALHLLPLLSLSPSGHAF